MSVWRLAVLGVSGLLLVAGAAGAAGAHTEVQRARPGPGEVVSGAPERVELVFLDPVLPGVDIEVTRPSDRRVAGLTDPVLDDGNRRATVTFDPLPAGAYVVAYEFAARDGDQQEEAFRFTVEAPSEPSSPGEWVGPGAAAAGLAAGVAVAVRRRAVHRAVRRAGSR